MLKIKTLKIPQKDIKYITYRKIHTVKELMTYPKLERDMEKYKIKGTYTSIVNIVESLKKDNANQIRRASYALYLWLRHDIIKLSQHKNEDEINFLINDKYGIFLPNTVRYFLKKELETNRIIDCGVFNNRHEFIGTLKGYIETIPNIDYQKKLTEYVIEGKTTREMAQSRNISFQAIALQLQRILPTNENLFENQFFSLFKKTNISKEQFYKIFPELPSDTYDLIKNILRSKKGKSSHYNIFSCINDEEIPSFIRERINKLYQEENVVTLENGDRIKIQNSSIVKYILAKYFNNKVFRKEDFVKRYYEITDYLLANNIKIKPYSIKKSNASSFFLANHPYILLTQNNRFRYVNTESIDYDKVLELCKLSQFKNISISSKLIYDQHPQEFYDLNLQNHYELYAYLKKKITTNPNIVFVRNPHIIFGKGDLLSQIKKIKKEHPSWIRAKVAKEMEKRYGFETKTISSNYL